MPTFSATPETIQLTNEHGTYMVHVRINNTITLPFILDTGATNVAVTADVVSTLIRSGTIKTSDFIGTGTAILADGSKIPSPRFMLHELQIGNHVIRNVVASITSATGDPLLGQSFLSKLP
jgi:predicted aspartyl protease